MITKSDLRVKLCSDEALYLRESIKLSSVQLRFKYKILMNNLENNIRDIVDEISRETAELRRDRKLLRLARTPTAIPATATAPETVIKPDMKSLIGQEHDVKMKAKRVASLKRNLSSKIESLKSQFEIDYQALKTDMEHKMICKRQIDSMLEFYKDQAEQGFGSDD